MATYQSKPWIPTHRLTTPQGRTVEVMLDDDGCAYEIGDWEGLLIPDYELFEGEWRFQGQPFTGKVERVQS